MGTADDTRTPAARRPRRRRSTTTSAAASPRATNAVSNRVSEARATTTPAATGPGPGRVERPPVHGEHGGQHEGGVQRVLHADERQPGEEQQADDEHRGRRHVEGPRPARPHHLLALRQHPHHGRRPPPR